LLRKTDTDADADRDGAGAPDGLRDLTLAGIRPDAGAVSHAGAARELDDLFARFERAHRAPLRAWAQAHLAPRGAVTTVFYPFGGPDFCLPHALFPQAQDFILVGVEPCTWDEGLDLDFAATVAAARHYLGFSYFITKDLKAAIASLGGAGVLPLLLMQIARCGLAVLKIEPLGAPARGIVITFGDPARPQRLSYVQQDLRDHHWPADHGLHGRLAAAGALAVFVKSASYLLHEAPFEALRRVIRARAALVVQDPSGVPYEVLRSWGWNVDLFGRFTRDIPVFARYDQSALAAAYRSEARAPLGFGIGYLVDPASASLMVAAPPEAPCAS
jgi:hypothetical protein